MSLPTIIIMLFYKKNRQCYYILPPVCKVISIKSSSCSVSWGQTLPFKTVRKVHITWAHDARQHDVRQNNMLKWNSKWLKWHSLAQYGLEKSKKYRHGQYKWHLVDNKQSIHFAQRHTGSLLSGGEAAVLMEAADKGLNKTSRSGHTSSRRDRIMW